MTEDDRALSPAEMLALAEEQKRSVQGQTASFVPGLMLVWGVVWLLGFGALWLVDGVDTDFSLPMAVAVCAGLLAIAVTVSIILSIRSGRGRRGDAASAFSGTVYGATWIIGIMAIVVLGQGLFANGMHRDLGHVFYPVSFVLCTGIMFVVGSAIWKAVPMLVIGLWLVVVALIATFVGHPTHYLVLAIGGGAGFLVLALVSAVYMSRLRRGAKGRRG